MMTSARFYAKKPFYRSFLLTLPVVATSLIVSACAPQSSPPRQVDASNPTVTYRYRGDQELLQANEKANGFCSQYHSIARTMDLHTESDGSKTVVFDCVAAAPVETATIQPLVTSNPNLGYTYRTDQELLTASRNADNYCERNGSSRAVGTTVTNVDGTRTVTFQCVPQ